MSLIDTLLNPNGRLSRLGFWTSGIILSLTVYAVIYAGLLIEREPTLLGYVEALPRFETEALWLLAVVPLGWIVFCLFVKRCHDRGKSGWWAFVALIPIIGQVWALIECGFMAGTRGYNRYGPSPDGQRARLMPYRLEDMPEDMP